VANWKVRSADSFLYLSFHLPRIDQLLRKLKRCGFFPQAAQDDEAWLVKLMTASLSKMFWIRTTSCESIFTTNYNLRP